MPSNTQARYMVRFDDICPTMNWEIWSRAEEVLEKHQVKPLLAVVPDNQDPSLAVAPARPDFWDLVRGWQARGYTIAIHGFRHQYVNGNQGMLRLNRRSEFAGLSRDEQFAKLDAATRIFRSEGVVPDAWIAPSHSFDQVTVDVLAELGVRTISDGLWAWPHTDADGVTWIPQQLWSVLKPMPPGIWTACYHHNEWSDGMTRRFASEVASFADQMTTVDAVLKEFKGRKIQLADKTRAWTDLTYNHKLRGKLWLVLSKLKGRR